MAGGQLVAKEILIDQIQRTMTDGESRVFTILTDKRRSIMLRFSEGKLIHSHCRSRNVEDAINALNDCIELKFNYSNAQSKEQPELMAAAEFIRAIAPDTEFMGIAEPVAGIGAEQRTLIGKTDTPSSSTQASSPATAETEEAINPGLREQFCEVARDYMGISANLLVFDVFAKNLAANATIAEIAAAIADPAQADDFRQRTTELVAADKAGGNETAADHRLFF